MEAVTQDQRNAIDAGAQLVEQMDRRKMDIAEAFAYGLDKGLELAGSLAIGQAGKEETDAGDQKVRGTAREEEA